MSGFSNIKYIDSHIHLDHIYYSDRKRVAWLRDAGCGGISWSYATGVDTASDIPRYLFKHAEIITYLSANALSCAYLAGIHPRNITRDLKPERIGAILLPHLENPLCRGIGEIGLEKGTSQEVEVLLAQLELAREVTERGKVFGIHTPRENKTHITGQILSLLEPFSIFREHIVIDHCMPETVSSVIEAGFRAGITVSGIKASRQDAESILDKHAKEVDRIMLNSDSGREFYEDFMDFAGSESISDDVKYTCCYSGARNFYGI